MSGSADTGAREPQDSVSAPLQKAQEMRERAENVLRTEEKYMGQPSRVAWVTRHDAAALARDVVALLKEDDELRAALAAGVGVARPAEPPRDDLVSAAENAARETTSRHTQSCQPGLGPKRSPAGERATGASKPSIGTAKPTNRTSSSAGENAPELRAEVGQLREALDEALSYRRTGLMPQDVLERLRGVSGGALRKERGDARGRAEAWAAHVRREAALTKELAGLREQLDAARQALTLIDEAFDPADGSLFPSEANAISAARAALGDVAAGGSLEANSAKNAEVRGGDNA